ncbi:MAG: trypsin-like peptidase domain-containing protein [Bacteroidales bacterium]|jgi:Do/DeqQ family serine protease|nr:trypsin-like peptidase domain-containing protein [Bacteroidales bacterium]
MKRIRINATTALFAVILGIASCNHAQESANALPNFTQAADKSVHSVVHIQCFYSMKTPTMADFFDLFMNPFAQMNPRQRAYQTSGSGVIIDAKEGYIITNNHVTEQADSIIVVLNDQRQFSARLIGNDPSADLAVIKIDNVSGLQALPFGNSDDVKVGEWVLAVGNPFNLTSTVTHGIVSAKARDINILGNSMSKTPIQSFIQTDAAVNPGNSGGALVNLDGDLIGINTAIASSTGSFAGYSFAIPSNIVRKVTKDLIKYGQTQKAYLGIATREMDKTTEDMRGIYVENVFKGGAADKAGLKQKDLITAINGRSVHTNAEYTGLMAQFSPDESVEVSYERNNTPAKKTITLLSTEGTPDENVDNGDVIKAIDASFRRLSAEETAKYNLRNGEGIVVISTKNSSLGRIGIRSGLIITSVDNEPATAESIKRLERKKGQQVVIEGFYPNGQQVYYMMIL